MNPIQAALVYSLWGIITYFFMVMTLTFLKNRNSLYDNAFFVDSPMVSIVVPAFNEEEGIEETIKSLLSIDYENLEIIVVNDGSTDRTMEIVEKHAIDSRIVLINNEKNIGKAASLNKGIEKAKGEFVACVDADTTLSKNVIKKTLPYFSNPDVASVVARIKVKRPRNWLERIIDVEYNLGLGFYLKLFSFLNCLYLTPGQFSIYRKKILEEINGFDENSIVEDTEIAYRIQKRNYKIVCCLSAVAYTSVPRNIKTLYYQRKRWYSGTLMTILKHRDVFFNKNLGNFGLFFMPINYGGIILGVMLFLSTLYLMVSSILSYMSNIRLIGYDFSTLTMNFIQNPSIDPLCISIFYFLGISPFIMNVVMNYLGMRSLGENIKENLFGFVCFLFFFIPYHIFWLIALYFVTLKKEVKWRESM
ncbi:MAG TPA: glycosyltransferase family 2 protein [Candidatus Altiarchaeales archaeon]|nr:glycosyltransferase family 2 protein [Candidatus Altiarchaeales archaeon]